MTLHLWVTCLIRYYLNHCAIKKLQLQSLNNNSMWYVQGLLSNCLNSGDELDTCLAQLAEELRPYMSTGLPDYNLPKTEPMFLDNVVIKLSKPPIDVTAIFTDSTVNGLSGFKLNSIHADTSSQSILLKMTIPLLSAAGDYSMTGNAIVTIDDSNGPYQVKI